MAPVHTEERITVAEEATAVRSKRTSVRAGNGRPLEARPDDGAAAPITRLTVNLPTWALDRLRSYATRRGDSLTQALKDAISVKLTIEEEREKGGRVYVRRQDGSHAELLLP